MNRYTLVLMLKGNGDVKEASRLTDHKLMSKLMVNINLRVCVCVFCLFKNIGITIKTKKQPGKEKPLNTHEPTSNKGLDQSDDIHKQNWTMVNSNVTSIRLLLIDNKLINTPEPNRRSINKFSRIQLHSVWNY